MASLWTAIGIVVELGKLILLLPLSLLLLSFPLSDLLKLGNLFAQRPASREDPIQFIKWFPPLLPPPLQLLLLLL